MQSLGGPLLLIGCGKMGGALLDGWIERGIDPAEITIVEPNDDQRKTLATKGVATLARAEEVPGNLAPALVALAVKPQQMDAALDAAGGWRGERTVFLSIAAGKTIGYFQDRLGAGTPVVRAMPNTPAAVGRGVSVLVASPEVPRAAQSLCEELLRAVGDVAWVEDEALMDAVTAVSGGGPAYVFLLIECLAKAGVESGLPEDLAMRIARGTVAGAGELVRQAEEPASKLRENVSSPGGTTLEALKVLMAEDGLQPLMSKAIAAATKRSRDLAE
ncbi:MAG: pyrroline-5-carboxylate reductase [Rhodovibrionaceae bacterium]